MIPCVSAKRGEARAQEAKSVNVWEARDEDGESV